MSTHEGLTVVESLGWKHWGLPVVDIDGEEYAVADNVDQAQKAALEAAQDSLWAFRSDYLASRLGLESKQVEVMTKALTAMQSELCEDATPIVELLLGDGVCEFLEDAVDADGRGHFLSPYDGEEQDGEDVVDPDTLVMPFWALEGKLVYRLN